MINILIHHCSNKILNKKKVIHSPGIEPGSNAWKAFIIPLDHEC